MATMVQDWVVAMLHIELLAKVTSMLKDWVVAMLEVELLTRVVARVVTMVKD